MGRRNDWGLRVGLAVFASCALQVSWTRPVAGVGGVDHSIDEPQTTGSASLASQSVGAVSADALNLTGLTHAPTMSRIFKGEFSEIDLDRDSPLFEAAFQGYLNAFGTQCADLLPASKVQMTHQECDTEQVTRNGFGAEVDRACVRWRDVPTGVFADPRLYAVRKSLEARATLDAGRRISQALAPLSQPNGLANTASLMGGAMAFAADMKTLLGRNTCDGPGVRRFEQNLVRFAEGKPSIRLDGTTRDYTAVRFRDQDYEAVIRALVEDDSKSWGGLATLVPQSIGNTRTTFRDDAGRPAEVTASYDHENLFGKRHGTVTLKFAGGVPRCFVYSETPATCHDAKLAIVEAFLRTAVPLAEAAKAVPQRKDFPGTESAEYTNVPPGFVPPLPGPRSYVYMPDQRQVGSLQQVTIPQLAGGNIGPLETVVRRRLPQWDSSEGRLIAEDMEAAFGAFPSRNVVTCYYHGERSFAFWVKERPAAADPTRLRARMANHPMLYIYGPVDNCPAYAEEAARLATPPQ